MSLRFRLGGMPMVALLLVAATSLSFLHAAVKPSKSDSEKAKYFIKSALKQSSAGNEIMYARMMETAWQLDSTNDYLRYEFASSVDDPEVGIKLMRPYYLKNSDDTYVAREYLAMLLWGERYDEALRIVDSMVEVRPENMELRILEGQTSMMADSIEKAIRAFEAASNLGADPEAIFEYKIKAYTVREDPDTLAALNIARDYLKNYPDNFDIFRRGLATAYTYDQKAEAFELAKSRVEAYPEDLRYRVFLYMVQSDNEDDEGAYKTMLEALELPSTDPNEFFDVINSDDPAMLPLYDEVVKKPGVTDETIKKYIVLQASLNDYEKVDSVLTAHPLTDLSPELVAYSAIMSKLALGKSEEAMDLYKRQQLVSGGENSIALTKMVLPLIYTTLDDKDNFMAMRNELLREYLPGFADYDELPPMDYYEFYPEVGSAAQLYLMESDLHNRAKNGEKSIMAARNAIMLQPENDEALNNYAYFVAEYCDDPAMLEKAMEYSASALRNSPDFNKFDTMSWILFKLGRYDQAEKLQEAVMGKIDESESNYDDFIGHLADIYSMNGKGEKAVEIWKRLLEKNPDDTNLQAKIKAGKYVGPQR